ncbi:MAG: methylenetetrahydrofolate--tRNA-(uracil(54)-C(5))-methyltransferase (FADH(2)-oxidizing) TrmFO [Anaerolineaceae bacterium]
MDKKLIIIGGGLAGSEAAWQAAQRGISVELYEMRPNQPTGAHLTGNLAELVCSNSLGSNLVDRASGLLKEELRKFKSMLLACAENTALPAGRALAVDREAFSEQVTEKILNHPNIKVIREEYLSIPNGPAIIASGPLTSKVLSEKVSEFTGKNNLFFYDAIAPIITADSIDFQIAFRASRYSSSTLDEGDYINCPFTKEEYFEFVNALKNAETIQLKEFESDIQNGVNAGSHQYFESCLPVEIIGKRGDLALAFGPLRPIGLSDPRTDKKPFAILQLRQDNLAGDLYNLVGFQTNLTYPEQKRIFRLIPGLKNAEFVRFGEMHRNTFIASPSVLEPTLQTRNQPDLFFAGQITGVEGYMGNIATGMLAGINAARLLAEKELLILPIDTMLGALIHYITQASLSDFQPMKANFGILPPLDNPTRNKRARAQEYSNRALTSLDTWLTENEIFAHE